MHGLRHKAEAQGGRLLRVLFVRLGAVSACAGPARRRAWRGIVLCLIGHDQSNDLQLTRLARECAHQLARVVAALRGHCRRFARSCFHSRRDLGDRSRLDGHRVHFECAAVQSYALPLHRTLLSCHDRAGDGGGRGDHHRRHTWMGLSGRDHLWGKPAYMVGDRADMGKVFLATVVRMSEAISGSQSRFGPASRGACHRAALRADPLALAGYAARTV